MWFTVSKGPRDLYILFLFLFSIAQAVMNTTYQVLTVALFVLITNYYTAISDVTGAKICHGGSGWSTSSRCTMSMTSSTMFSVIDSESSPAPIVTSSCHDSHAPIVTTTDNPAPIVTTTDSESSPAPIVTTTDNP
jgi:hypothetical protein